MEEKLHKAVEILKKHNQEHLLYFYDELEDEQKIFLLDDILSTNFKELEELFENSKKDDSIAYERISPLPYHVKSNLSSHQEKIFNTIGENIIKKQELAIITLAGGMGTRLGYKGPKGAYEIEVPPKKSLFEFICDKLKIANEKYDTYIPWYIMTSPSNDVKTKEFFEMHNYFNYPKEKIFFFIQDVLPIIDIEGKVILDNIYTIAKASNGNGDIFRALSHTNLLDEMVKNNIKWISVSGIDNIILDLIDPIFIGLSSYNNSKVASKSIAQTEKLTKDWVFAMLDNKPSIVNSKNLTDEMRSDKFENGLLKYNQINILSHLFTIDALLLLKDKILPYHRAYKKHSYINEEGMKVVPNGPNSFKFEKFIFDSFKYFDNFTLLEVAPEDEFAPIKAFTGDYTPETALELYLNKMERLSK